MKLEEKFGTVNCRELTDLNIKQSAGFKEYYAKVHDYSCADRIRFASCKSCRNIRKMKLVKRALVIIWKILKT
jgi:hypothetical protein